MHRAHVSTWFRVSITERPYAPVKFLDSPDSSSTVLRVSCFSITAGVQRAQFQLQFRPSDSKLILAYVPLDTPRMLLLNEMVIAGHAENLKINSNLY